MNLLELEAVEVVGESIVGCVLEVWLRVLVIWSIGECMVGCGDGNGGIPAREWTAIFWVADILKL